MGDRRSNYVVEFRGNRSAFGAPGLEPRWSHGDKVGVGTSYSADSRAWFTLWRGVVTECYYPTIDRPQLRDWEFLFTDDSGLLLEERRHFDPEITPVAPHALGYRVLSRDADRRVELEKQILTDPHLPVVLQHVRISQARSSAGLRTYLLAAPHLDGGGWGNQAYVVRMPGRELLAATRNGIWLAIGATVPFEHLSCGYVGASDLYTDLLAHRRMTWEFDRAENGNVALGAELAVGGAAEFTVGIAFGQGLSHAVSALLPSLATPFDEHRRRFIEQWERARSGRWAPTATLAAHRPFFETTASLLLAHEDKTFPGAFIASSAIPWGTARSDDDRGGYHLVWTRDLCAIATGLLASGHPESALRSLIYLAACQRNDGGFPQNFWLTGEPYWTGVQLDEVAAPILLADLLDREKALAQFDPGPLIRTAARFLVEHGPVTGQERWEEASGLSPSTLAAEVSALAIAAHWADRTGDGSSARFLWELADDFDDRVERWTVTQQGTLVPGISRHYVRILPTDPSDPSAPEELDSAMLTLANQPPNAPPQVPARLVVDAGFLQLVRYGIRNPKESLVQDSVRVVDETLRVETPFGPTFHRYSGDGYGETDDGDPFVGAGHGRAWPLLSGERGHFELARGGDPLVYLQAMERMGGHSGLLPEQVWDEADRPLRHLFRGRPTGSARPLLWAHAEYAKLLRSIAEKRVFDRVPVVEQRYASRTRGAPPRFEVWKPRRQPRTVGRGSILRILGMEPFRLHWSRDGWSSTEDTESVSVPLGVEFVDIPVDAETRGPIAFTFFWPGRSAWEGRDYRVDVTDPSGP